MTTKKSNCVKYKTNTYDIGGFLNKLRQGSGLGKFGTTFSDENNSALLSAAGNFVGNLANNAISGGMQSGAGNVIGGLSKVASAVPGPWGAIASTGLNVVGGLVNRAFGSKMNNENINSINSRINNMNNFQSNVGSFDELANIISSTANATDFSNKYVGKDGWFSNKAKKKANDLRDKQQMAQAFVDNTIFNNMENIEQNQLNNLEANYAALGGPLFAYGGDFSNGVAKVNNGGTHEENPLGGVPMGISAEGTPNLVEQGEVIFNDYVFSDRMTADTDLLDKYNLPKAYQGKSFATIAERLGEESKERPNDPISRRGLLSSMSRLQQAQETVRQQTQKGQEGVQYAHGGRMGTLFDGFGDDPNILFPTSAEDWAKLMGTKTPKYGVDWYPTGKVSTIVGESPKGMTTFNTVPTSYWEALGKGNKKANTYISNKSGSSSSKSDDDNRGSSGLNWLRYAPVIGSAIGLSQNLLSRPDYTNADTLLEAANNVGNYTPVSYSPIGNYLGYKPFDRDFYINKLNAQSGATRRAIMNTAGPARNAAILAADYNAQGRLGDLARQAEEYNLAQRQAVENFNRGTNTTNAEMGLRAAMANQSAQQQSRAGRLSGIMQAMAVRDAIDTRRNASMNANLTNLFDNLGNIGIDAYNREDRDKLIRAGIFGTLSEKPQEWSDKRWQDYKGALSGTGYRNGGKLKKRRGGLTY
jgi:hypothetical protein